MMRVWACCVVLAGWSALAQERVDECSLKEDRCYRAAVELRAAWDNCAAPRLVVDESAYSSGVQRLQGVWCEFNPAHDGVFHSAPVAWAWVAATSGRTRLDGERIPRTSRLTRSRALQPHRFYGDGGQVAALVEKRLLAPHTRLGGATLVVVEGSTVFVVERQPLGELRPQDLPWGLEPWRPAWFFMPELSCDERLLLESVTVQHVIRTTRDGECLVNSLSGKRLLSEGPIEQDVTVKAVQCEALASQFALQSGPVFSGPALPLYRMPVSKVPKVREFVVEALTTPTDPLAFERPKDPNVDAFPTKRVP
jgi:hypothetical protein